MTFRLRRTCCPSERELYLHYKLKSVVHMRGNHSLTKTPQAFLSRKRATNMSKKKNGAPVKKVFYPKMPLVWGGGIKLLPEWWIPIALSSRAWSWPANKCDGNYAFIFSGRHFHQSKRKRQWKVITLPAWLRCSHSQASLLQQVHWNTCLEPFFFFFSVHCRLSTFLTKQAHWPGITVQDEF